jgi:maleamate amidohydrolase
MTIAVERALYRRQGFGAHLGIHGQIGLLLVDFVRAFADPSTFGGGNIRDAIGRSRELLAIARAKGWPVAHSRIVFAAGGANANIFSEKVPGLLRLTEDAAESAIVDELLPGPHELVVRKLVPSAFFGTELAAWLLAKEVRTLVVAGCTTSGCVRASVIDAMSHGFRPLIVRECVGDRAIGAHKVSLFEIEQKYADVVSIEALTAKLRRR